MTYPQLAYLHLATVAPVFLIGLWLFLMRKGTPVHKVLGRIYGVLMLFTAVVSLFMPARVGPSLFGHFGYIHILSVVVLVSIPMAVLAIRRGDVRSHQAHMIGVYVGGILIAGAFTFMPGRMLHGWVFG